MRKNSWSTGQTISDAYRLIITSSHSKFPCLPTYMQNRVQSLVSKETKFTVWPFLRKELWTSFSKHSIHPTYNKLLCTCSLFRGKRESRNSFTILPPHVFGRHHHRPSVLLDSAPTFIFLSFYMPHLPERKSMPGTSAQLRFLSTFIWGGKEEKEWYKVFYYLFCLYICCSCCWVCFAFFIARN